MLKLDSEAHLENAPPANNTFENEVYPFIQPKKRRRVMPTRPSAVHMIDCRFI